LPSHETVVDVGAVLVTTGAVISLIVKDLKPSLVLPQLSVARNLYVLNEVAPHKSVNDSCALLEEETPQLSVTVNLLSQEVKAAALDVGLHATVVSIGIERIGLVLSVLSILV
jgi:hypothetical protein